MIFHKLSILTLFFIQITKFHKFTVEVSWIDVRCKMLAVGIGVSHSIYSHFVPRKCTQWEWGINQRFTLFPCASPKTYSVGI